MALRLSKTNSGSSKAKYSMTFKVRVVELQSKGKTCDEALRQAAEELDLTDVNFNYAASTKYRFVGDINRALDKKDEATLKLVEVAGLNTEEYDDTDKS